MALIFKTGKLGEGKTYRLRNGQSGAGMLSGWIAPAQPGPKKGGLRAGPEGRACAATGPVSALPVGNHGENV